jgi:ADP-ribose pyrophosphatase YjhB (NUDIX family)
MIDRLRRARWIARLLHVYWRFSRGLTVGVRAIVLDREGRVFLVRHGYADGWHLPGGGVEPGETLRHALDRELAEEGHIELTGPAVLHGVFFQERYSNRDHVAVYVAREFRQTSVPDPNREIVETGFFPLDALPAGVTTSTRARIDEALHGRPLGERW